MRKWILSSGTYSVKVAAEVGESNVYGDYSATVSYTYNKPSDQIPAPINVRWEANADWIFLVWDMPSGFDASTPRQPFYEDSTGLGSAAGAMGLSVTENWMTVGPRAKDTVEAGRTVSVRLLRNNY